jgi:hypothetical protein
VIAAHIGGLPIEETLVAFAPAGVAFAAAMHMARDRTRRAAGRLAALTIRRRPASRT